MSAHTVHGHKTSVRETLGLTKDALGVVYGDIGTSILYAVKEGAHIIALSTGAHALAIGDIMGFISLVFWAIILVVSTKYCAFILNAHYKGEGGILALLHLIRDTVKAPLALVALGIFCTALLFGDGMITPPISVLSAVEGLEVLWPATQPFVVPITIGIIIPLFMIQRFGTHGIGRFFGWIMMTWFLINGVLGFFSITQTPDILNAVHPHYALDFMFAHPMLSFIVLGAVTLSITGGEALYADLGHFGATPIRLGWFGLAMPALLLNYFGQGAELLRHPDAFTNPGFNPFFALVPQHPILITGMIILATMATIIASQALISGSFSMARQAIEMGFLPRMRVIQTSIDHSGQIYIPLVNYALMLGCVLIVVGFQSSSALAAAYGLTVTGAMGGTTILFWFLTTYVWRWNQVAASFALMPLFGIDMLFFGSNLTKFFHGGYLPLTIAILLSLIMGFFGYINHGKELGELEVEVRAH